MKELSIAKIISLALLSTIPIYFFLVTILKYYVNAEPMFNPNELSKVIIALGIVGAISFSSAFYVPRVIKLPKFSAHIYRVGVFESIGIYGFILGLLGADWNFVIPFFIVSFIGLIISFPSEGKWRKL